MALCLGAHQGVTAQESVGASPAPRPPYLQRGDEVEARYRSYQERLDRFFQDLGARLEPEAPDLLAKLRETPPTPVAYGYGILPKLVPAPPRPSGARIASVSYSWRRTEGFIDRDVGRLEKLDMRLAPAAEMTAEDRRREWAKMVDEYRTLAANQKLIASHIEYNRLWQREITRNRRGYDLGTSLHDAVLERQALLDTLQAGDQALEPSLRAREEALSGRIQEVNRKVTPAPFVRAEHPSPHRWIVRVPVSTDIEDRSFVEAFRAAVENAWRVQDGDDEFRVVVDIRYVPASQLYPDGGLPAHGEHIDLAKHIGRFPSGGAVLTTGANSTHVLGYGINLGPHDMAPNGLAHELGHILGFVDLYVRGYRDRGPEGYEVLEVLIDPDDIMGSAGNGRVGRHHFERLLRQQAGEVQ